MCNKPPGDDDDSGDDTKAKHSIRKHISMTTDCMPATARAAYSHDPSRTALYTRQSITSWSQHTSAFDESWRALRKGSVTLGPGYRWPLQ